jgi:hypothetical protein
MNGPSLFSVFITLAVIAGFLALGYGLYRHGVLIKRHAEERRQRARELGWSYDDTPDGNIDFRLSGTSRNIRWELVYDSDRSSSESSPRVVWRWRDRPVRRIEMALMSAAADKIAFGPIGRNIIGFARKLGVKSKSHPDGDDFYDHALKVESDLSVFQDQWIVRARRPSLFRSVASHEIASLLTGWPPSVHHRHLNPAVTVNLLYDHEGLTLECSLGVLEMSLLEHLVKLGTAVAVKLSSIHLDAAI